MLDIAARLSAPFPFVRVDLYASATEFRVGELTFCPNAGNVRVEPDSADIELGKLFTSFLPAPGA
ncbi:MAG: ATP-grasp fold amidoligase family protein [Chloroflexi bacterium]|nr:ATP-grasp fold amidoligase family protein [Chloroflexota bacterium]